MKKIFATLSAVVLALSLVAPATANPQTAGQLAPAAKNSFTMTECSSNRQLDCIESFGILQGPSGAQSLTRGKQIDARSKIHEICLSSGDCTTWETEKPAPLWEVKTASGTYKYVLQGLFMNRKFKDSRSGLKGGGITFSITGINGALVSNESVKVQIRIRSSWLAPGSLLLDGREADWKFDKIAGGNRFTYSAFASEIGTESANFSSYFWLQQQYSKKDLPGYRCVETGTLLFSSDNLFSRSRNLGMDWNQGSKAVQISYSEVYLNASIPVSGDTPEQVGLVVDTKYLNCISRNALKGAKRFVVEVLDSSGSVVTVTQKVVFAKGRLSIRLNDLPAGGFTLSIKAAKK